MLQPFVDEARALGVSHDIVDAAESKLKVCARAPAIRRRDRCVGGEGFT
jgi:hypothetical protein